MPGSSSLPVAEAPSLRHWLWTRRWLALGLAILFVTPRIWYHWTFQGDDFDLGIYHGVADNLAHGRWFFSDVLGYNHLAEHWNPVMLLFAPLYWLWPSAFWLMAAQGLAAAATVLALVWLAERHLAGLTERRRAVAWWCLLALFVTYRPFTASWWFSFQPIVLGAPCLAWALVFLHLGRMRSLAVAVILLLTTREAAVLSCLGLAWYAWRIAGRPRAAIAIAATAAVVAFLVFVVVMPSAQEHAGWGHTSRVGLLANPLGKVRYLAGLLLCAGLLPVFAPVIALAALPAAALQLVVSTETQFSGGFHYNAQLSVFLLAASAAGMAKLLTWMPAQAHWKPLAIPVLALGIAVSAGDILPLRKFAAAMMPRRWIEGFRMQTDLARALEIPGIGTDVPLCADPRLGPWLRTRAGYRCISGSNAASRIRKLPPGLPLLVRTAWWSELCTQDPGLSRRTCLVGDGGSILVLRLTTDDQTQTQLAPAVAR